MATNIKKDTKQTTPTPRKRTATPKKTTSPKVKPTPKEKEVKKVEEKKDNNGFSAYLKRNLPLITLILTIAGSVYIFMSSLSFAMMWSSEYSELATSLKELLVNETGKVGAKIGKILVRDWFGVFGIALPLAIIATAILCYLERPKLVVKSIFVTSFGLIIWCSAASFFFSSLNGIFGSSLGGGVGLILNDIFASYVGQLGTLLLILVLILLWLLLVSPKILVFIGKMFRYIFGGILKGLTPKKKAADIPLEIQITKPEEVTPVVTEDKTEETTAPIIEKKEEQETKPEEVTPVKKDEEKKKEVDFSFAVATTDEIERQGTNREDMNTEEFEIVVSADTEIKKDSEGNCTLIEIESDAVTESEIEPTLYDPTLDLSRYKMPTVDLLEERVNKTKISESEIHENKERILTTLRNFSIEISSIRATVGPTVTLYEIVPAVGVRISKIKNLEDDIALSLSALGIRIIAPMPGKGTIGIEVPNKNKEIVSMRSVVMSSSFQDSEADLPIVLGRTISNQNFVLDLAKMPHMLVAGATGQGKSVGLNAIVASLLYKKHPAELKFVMVDPKKVELSLYASLENHFLAKMEEEPEAIITDTQRVINTLNSLCIEMDERYDLLKLARMKNIKEYNDKFKRRVLNPNKGHRFMPYIVVIIDEFADLIMTAGKEIETPISRIAQLARAVGIHLVIATQRPAVNVITGVIKANFPARIAFKVMTSIDSKIILDTVGANQLIGRGDMLVSTGGEVTRVQCAFIDTPEIERIAEYIGDQVSFGSPMILPEYVPDKDKDNGDMGGALTKRDGLFDEIARYVVVNQQGSASTIQRNFSIGFNRAGRIMDQLEKAGIVGKQVGSKPRDVRIPDLTTLEILLYDLDNQRTNVE